MVLELSCVVVVAAAACQRELLHRGDLRRQAVGRDRVAGEGERVGPAVPATVTWLFVEPAAPWTNTSLGIAARCWWGA